MATEGQKPANEIQLLSPLAELRVRSLGEIRTLERTKASRVEVTGFWRTATDRAETFLGFVFFTGHLFLMRSRIRAEVQGKL